MNVVGAMGLGNEKHIKHETKRNETKIGFHFAMRRKRKHEIIHILIKEIKRMRVATKLRMLWIWMKKKKNQPIQRSKVFISKIF